MNRSKKVFNYVKLLSEEGEGWMLRRDYMVASAFIPNPNNYKYVKHLDGDTLNSEVSNLAWVEKKPRGDNAVSQFEDKENAFEVESDVNPKGYNITVNMRNGNKIHRDSGE